MTQDMSEGRLPRLSVERSARIYDDDHGFWVQIAPDRDGLENAEITYSDGDKAAKETSIVLPWPHMIALANAILEVAARQYCTQKGPSS